MVIEPFKLILMQFKQNLEVKNSPKRLIQNKIINFLQVLAILATIYPHLDRLILSPVDYGSFMLYFLKQLFLFIIHSIQIFFEFINFRARWRYMTKLSLQVKV